MAQKARKSSSAIKARKKIRKSNRNEGVLFTLKLDRTDWRRLAVFITLFAFLIGLGSGYLLWDRQDAPPAADAIENTGEDEHVAHIALGEQVNPPEGYTLQFGFGDIGPQLLLSGAIDRDAFVQLYEKAKRPLDETQLAILEQGSETQIVLNKQNAYFLLNFFWAFGLVNHNTILIEGPMTQNGENQIGRFASTGGWTLGSKPAMELYASTPILTLTAAQQQRLEEVASEVYRPCCNNPTHFPDCNHGMAMLGLLELMASQDASTKDMFVAAKYANAFWYPTQSIELAQFFKSTQNMDFADVDSQELVSRNYSSASGFKAVHEWLANNGQLPQTPGSGSSCGV
jgi:hypothetical protein